MILKSKHHPIIYPFFKQYAIRKITKHYHKINIIGDYENKDTSILLIANHVSWWDGFFAMYLNVKIFKRKFHFMMLEEQLRKYMFFNKSGGFSVKKGSKNILESINYTSELLTNKNNLVLLFPQGKIQSLYTSSFQFEKGVERILKNANCKVQIIFLANLVDYFSNPKPSLYMYLSEYQQLEISAETLQNDYNSFYAECVCKNLQKTES